MIYHEEEVANTIRNKKLEIIKKQGFEIIKIM